MDKAKVHFTGEIKPEAVARMYRLLGKELPCLCLDDNGGYAIPYMVRFR